MAKIKDLDFSIGIYKPYDYPDFFRQTPGQNGIWGNTKFLVNDFSQPCDVLVVMNFISEKVEIQCGEVWLVIQEPPLNYYPWIFKGHAFYAKIFSPSIPQHSDSRYLLSHGALPWHVDMTYDVLKNLSPPSKNLIMSWITSNKTMIAGHKKRMNFLRSLQDSDLGFDLFGRGFNPIDNKYKGLGSYRYSLAIENYSQPHYWTEKVADCFLSWTMPIYYGCTNLSDYFPEESFLQIDIDDPGVIDQIKDIVRSDLYIRNKDAIAEARRLVLDKYQLFPFLDNVIKSTALSPIKKKVLYPYQERWTFKNLRKFNILRKLRKPNID